RFFSHHWRSARASSAVPSGEKVNSPRPAVADVYAPVSQRSTSLPVSVSHSRMGKPTGGGGPTSPTPQLRGGVASQVASSRPSGERAIASKEPNGLTASSSRGVNSAL